MAPESACFKKTLMKRFLLAAFIFTCITFCTAENHSACAQGLVDEDYQTISLGQALQQLVAEAPSQFSAERDENSRQAESDHLVIYKGLLHVRTTLPSHRVIVGPRHASYEMYLAKGIPMAAAADKSKGVVALAEAIIGDGAKVLDAGPDVVDGRSRHLTRITRGKGPYILVARYDAVSGTSDVSVKVVD
jgi:hypothetical protein